METLEFDKNRRKAKYCPCDKSNRDGKFAPFKDYINKGYCFSCDKTFFPEKGNIVEPYQFKPVEPIKLPSYHPLELVKSSGRNFNQNNFIQFLRTLFSEEEVKSTILKYLIGTSKHWKGSTVFWQVDNYQKVRHGKIIRYNARTGKKMTRENGDAFISSARKALKIQGFNLKQCLFGLHLINESHKQSIALVEGEKTAVIMSLFKPEYTWLATGGIGGLKWEYMIPLKGYKIIAYPDKHAFSLWKNKAIELKKYGIDIYVSQFIEDRSYPKNTDLADVYIDLKKQNNPEKRDEEQKSIKNTMVRTKAETTALKLAKINPAIKKLIQEFELTDNNGILIRI